VRPDLTVDEVMALVAGAFAAIRHANAESSRERSAHIAKIILDGLRPNPDNQDPTAERRDPRPEKVRPYTGVGLDPSAA
jgi:hypothetical protein